MAKPQKSNCLRVKAGVSDIVFRRRVAQNSELSAIREILDNAMDAGTAEVICFLDNPEKPTRFTVVDTGTGMAPDAFEAFFNYGMSSWKRTKTKGRNGEGAIFILHHVKSVRYITKTADIDFARTFRLDLDSWLNLVTTNAEVEIQEIPLGTHQYEPEGAESFTIVEMELYKAKANAFTLSNLIENLAEYLAPQYVDRVFINGEKIQPIEGLIRVNHTKEDRVLGEIVATIYRPKMRRTKSTRFKLSIGAFGPIVDFHNFVSRFPKDLQQDIPSLYSDPDVCGNIDVARFNDWRDGASNEFLSDLFNERALLEQFVRYLKSLAKVISKEFGYSDSSMADREVKNLEVLRAQSIAAFGEIPNPQTETTGRRMPHTFNVSPYSSFMVPGEGQIFEVAKCRRNDVFHWDTSHLPKHSIKPLDPKNQSVEITILQDAKYELKEQYRIIVTRNDQEAEIKIAYVEIQPVKRMRLQPRFSNDHLPNDLLVIQVKDMPGATLKLEWSVEPADAGTFMRSKNIMTQTFVFNRPGMCTVTAKDPNNQAIVAQGKYHCRDSVKVGEYESGVIVPQIRLVNTIMTIRTYRDDQLPKQAYLLGNESDGNHVVCRINTAHPAYKDASRTDSAWRTYVLTLLVQQDVFRRFSSGSDQRLRSINDVADEIGEILSKF